MLILHIYIFIVGIDIDFIDTNYIDETQKILLHCLVTQNLSLHILLKYTQF